MQSVEEIYQTYSKNVYRYLLSLTHDADVAEEVLQETFYQAIKNIHRYDESCKITTWLCAIARNQLQVYRRKHPAMEPLEKENSEGEIISEAERVSAVDSAESKALEENQRMELLKLLHLLKEPQREILYLRSFGGLSFKEIGEIFDKSENWARVTFYRGKEQLRKELEENEISITL